VLAGCENHPKQAVHGAPEYLHKALAGDADAQGVLADCYGSGSCPGVPSDPAMACAWRGVRLASRRADLTLADAGAFSRACASQDPTFRQRSAIAFADLTTRVYGREPPELSSVLADISEGAVLYPSIERVRILVNAELARAGQSEPLPPLTSPILTSLGNSLRWSSCTKTVCLEAETPAIGGGVRDYSISAKATGATAPNSLAARLAAAGLEWPSIADRLTTDKARDGLEGQVCWRMTQSDRGDAMAEAAAPPCRSGDRGQ